MPLTSLPCPDALQRGNGAERSLPPTRSLPHRSLSNRSIKSCYSTLLDVQIVDFAQACVASYRNHTDAESSVRFLLEDGLPIKYISVIGRNFETQEDIQGFYRPADAASNIFHRRICRYRIDFYLKNARTSAPPC